MPLVQTPLGLICFSGGDQAVHSVPSETYDDCQVPTSGGLPNQPMITLAGAADERIARGYILHFRNNDAMASDMIFPVWFDDKLIDSHRIFSILL